MLIYAKNINNKQNKKKQNYQKPLAIIQYPAIQITARIHPLLLMLHLFLVVSGESHSTRTTTHPPVGTNSSAFENPVRVPARGELYCVFYTLLFYFWLNLWKNNFFLSFRRQLSAFADANVLARLLFLLNCWFFFRYLLKFVHIKKPSENQYQLFQLTL